MSTQTIEIMQNGIARLKLAAYKPDMVIAIPRDLAMFWEFDRAAELIEFGYQRADDAIEKFGKTHPEAMPKRADSANTPAKPAETE